MSLRFIVGRAGAGKTRVCLDEVKERILAAPDGPPLIVLVPEQASFQTEYALTSEIGIKGFMRVQVLSFRRLAYRVLLEAGGAARAHIGETGKRMALRRLMEEHRDKLRVFGRVCSRPGFADTLARTIGEMKLYCVSPADLAAACTALSDNERETPLVAKLRDIQLLYAELESFLADRFTDPDDYLSLLAERLPKTKLVRDAEVWVDGFTGFTPQEYTVLLALLKTANRVNVSLCADINALRGGLTEGDLFYPAWDTYKDICEIAAGEGVLIEPVRSLGQGRSSFVNPAIAHLEKNYFRRPDIVSRRAVTDMLLASAASRWAEVEGVAREIISLCRDKGYRYREIVVLVRDLEAYGQIISFVFSDHHIPVFIDRKRPVLNHPLVELVRSALESVVRNWAFDPVFRYLKTGLAPLTREEVDLLENYVLARGIRGSRWTDDQPWGDVQETPAGELSQEIERGDSGEYGLPQDNGVFAGADGCEQGYSGRGWNPDPTNDQFVANRPGAVGELIYPHDSLSGETLSDDLIPDKSLSDDLLSDDLLSDDQLSDDSLSDYTLPDETDIDRIRRVAAAALACFDQAVRKSDTVREITEALFSLLTQLNVPGVLSVWSTEAQSIGALETAREHSQVWGLVIELLDQIVEALGDESLKPKDYAMVLDAGFEGMSLGLIPPGLDQVVAGSLDRSRNPSARACFIMGVNEGVLPAHISEHGILTEVERETLGNANLQLSPGARRRVFDEQYYVYLALTRATEYLSLSYPTGDEDGGAGTPSPVLARIKELLPGIAEKEWSLEPNQGVGEELDFITNPHRSLSYLAISLRETKNGSPLDPLWRDVYNWYIKNDDWRSVCARSLGGLFYHNQAEDLDFRVAGQLYGRPFRTSVTGIERLRACPFAHFLANGLLLRERAVLKLRAPDIGQFSHAVLKLYGDRLNELGLDWGEVEEPDSRRIAGEAADYLAPRMLDEMLVDTPRQSYLTGKIKRSAQRAVSVMSEHARRGSFRPVGLELAFGPGGALPALVIDLPNNDKMILSGRVDRVDAAEAANDTYLRVIDYKSSHMTLSLYDIWYGLRLQLLTYLEVAVKHGPKLTGSRCLPGGMFYFALDDPLIQTEGEILTQAEIEKKILKKMKMEGMILADTDVVRLMDKDIAGVSSLLRVHLKKDGHFALRSTVVTEEQFALIQAYLYRQLTDAGSAILNGTAAIAPYRQGQFRSCNYCLFRQGCHFDQLIEGNAFRQLPALAKDIVWNKLTNLMQNS